jgi:hypothetical protein
MEQWMIEASAGWLLALTAGLALGWARLRRLERAARVHDDAMREIRLALGGLQRDLRGVARSQQVADLRRRIVADLRPVIADAVDVRLAGRPQAPRAPGIEFSGATTLTGPTVGGDVSALRAGASTGHAE